MPDQPETSYYDAAGYGTSGRSRSAAYSRAGSEPGADHGLAARSARPATPYAQAAARYEAAGRLGEQRPAEEQPGTYRSGPRRAEPGLPGWAAVLLLIVLAGACGLVDSLSGASVRGVFNIGLIVASLVAIIAVRRSQMFVVVISPPLVYLAASAALLYIRSGGLHDRGKLIDAATNWVVYGFPAIAGATAVVLLVAGLRLVARR